MRSSRSGAAASGTVASARSRAGLSPGDQNPSRHSSSGGAGTSKPDRAAPGRRRVLARRRRLQNGRGSGAARRAVRPGRATPGQHRERVVVELLGQHVADRGQVLAGHAPVGAGAVHLQVARRTAGTAGCRTRRTRPRSRAASRRPAAWPGTAPGAPSFSVHRPPLRGGQRQHADPDLVRARAASPAPGRVTLPCAQLELQHLAAAGVVPAAGQAAAHAERLQHARRTGGTTTARRWRRACCGP